MTRAPDIKDTAPGAKDGAYLRNKRLQSLPGTEEGVALKPSLIFFFFS